MIVRDDLDDFELLLADGGEDRRRIRLLDRSRSGTAPPPAGAAAISDGSTAGRLDAVNFFEVIRQGLGLEEGPDRRACRRVPWWPNQFLGHGSLSVLRDRVCYR